MDVSSIDSTPASRMMSRSTVQQGGNRGHMAGIVYFIHLLLLYGTSERNLGAFGKTWRKKQRQNSRQAHRRNNQGSKRPLRGTWVSPFISENSASLLSCSGQTGIPCFRAEIDWFFIVHGFFLSKIFIVSRSVGSQSSSRCDKESPLPTILPH